MRFDIHMTIGDPLIIRCPLTNSDGTDQLRYGASTPTALYYGNQPVTRAYLGSTLVWES